MHIVEQNTLAVLEGLLKRLDPTRIGWCIDAGVGVQDYYFARFFEWGYRAVGIDPVHNPFVGTTEPLSDEPIMIVAALYNVDDKITFYDGHDGNTASVNQNWQDVTGHPHPGTSHEVQAIRYETLCDRLEIKRVSCLKMDIEDSELAVIETLPDSTPRPLIVTFEYGGGFSKASGMGGWAQPHFARALRCLDILHEMGYTHAAHCEDDVRPFAFADSPQGRWLDNAGYGNMVVWEER